jgi:hypothetical protein
MRQVGWYARDRPGPGWQLFLSGGQSLGSFWMCWAIWIIWIIWIDLNLDTSWYFIQNKPHKPSWWFGSIEVAHVATTYIHILLGFVWKRGSPNSYDWSLFAQKKQPYATTCFDHVTKSSYYKPSSYWGTISGNPHVSYPNMSAWKSTAPCQYPSLQFSQRDLLSLSWKVSTIICMYL